MRALSAGMVALAVLPVTSVARPADETEPVFQNSPERRVVEEQDWGRWLGPYRAKLVPSLMQDFGERYIYVDANRALSDPLPGERRVVFIGDSITDRWDLARSFPGKPYVNRGIGSQVTAQMVLRFQQDVVALEPAAVVILAGINDLHGFLQKETPETITQNYQAMADIADRHGIEVIFCSILPIHNYTDQARTMLQERNPETLRQLNDWLRRFAAQRGYGYADYHAAMADGTGLLRRELAEDGIHPLRSGYAIMAPILQAEIDRALSP